MELKMVNDKGAAGTFNAPDTLFGRDFNEALVHQVVVAYQANARSGTRKQKERGEIAKSTRKPWRQKGTGRARAGTIRSPLWRGGGVTFAAKPQSYDQKVNKKMYRAALRVILSELVRQDRLVVVDDFKVEQARTRVLLDKLKSLGLDDVLIVVESPDEALMLAARNLHAVDVRDASGLDPVSLIGFQKVLVTVPVLKQLEERLG